MYNIDYPTFEYFLNEGACMRPPLPTLYHCRFAITRCSEINLFQVAATMLKEDLTRHIYVKERMRGQLYNIRNAFFLNSPFKKSNLTLIHRGNKL